MRLFTGLVVIGFCGMLTGCPDDEQQLPAGALSLELNARKDYRPAKFTDGLYSFAKDTQFQIPSKLVVASGDAEEYRGTLYFKKAQDKKESRCDYKGVEFDARRKGESQKERVFTFVKCDGKLKSGSVTLAKDLRLRVGGSEDGKKAGFTILKASILYAGGAPTPTPTAVVTATPTATPTPDIFAGLPPDPGEAGRETVLGIDSDNDGVRDDIQRWIVQTAPNSKPIRNALRQYAANARKLYAALGNDAEVLRLVQESSNSSDCAHYVMKVEGMPNQLDVLDSLRALLINSYLRRKAESEVSNAASGQTFGGSNVQFAKESDACKFDVNDR
jgi:hypothetical protein